MDIEPMTWEELTSLPLTEQKLYVEEVRDTFTPTYTELSTVFGVDCRELILYFKDNDFAMSNTLGRRILPPQIPSKIEQWRNML